MTEQSNTESKQRVPRKHHGENPFVQIEDWTVDLLMSDELTKTDHRLFWYLFKLDRWGDRFINLPSQSEIALALGVRRETINQSQAKLQRLGLWDFQVTKWKGRNLAGVKATSQVLEKSNSGREKSNRPRGKSNTARKKSNSTLENPHNPKAEASVEQGIEAPYRSDQTSSDSSRPLSEGERENFEIDPEFRAWLTKKASQLPKPPALLEQWIEAQAKVEANQKDFLKSKGTGLKANVPPPVLGVEKIDQLADRLLRLQAEWRASSEGGRKAIAEEVERHPEWGVEIGDDGPQEVSF